MLQPADGAVSYIHQVDSASITPSPSIGLKRNGITLRRPCRVFVPNYIRKSSLIPSVTVHHPNPHISRICDVPAVVGPRWHAFVPDVLR